MAEAADRLLAFASGKVSGDLHQDEMQYFGVVKNLEIIGEAAYMLTKQFREEHSEVPWKKVMWQVGQGVMLSMAEPGECLQLMMSST